MMSNSFDSTRYALLLSETLPGMITTEAENERILEIIGGYMQRGVENLSPEETKLYLLLSELVQNFEERTFPMPGISPHEALQFLMQENNLKQSDLLEIFGSSGIASEVVGGKRAVSKSQARRLAARFKVSVELFV